MREFMRFAFFLCGCLYTAFNWTLHAQPDELASCNMVWNTQSKNSAESMPCGGGDIGLNVWVENNELMFYLSQSGTFDENNGFQKLGRVRIMLTPNPFEGKDFKQELVLKDGYVSINGRANGISAQINLWVDVFRPVIHVNVDANAPIQVEAIYENWRYQDRLFRKSEGLATSFKWGPIKNLKALKDDIDFKENNIVFYHRNKNDSSAFDITVQQQGLSAVKQEMFNPLKNLTFGGFMQGENMIPAGSFTGKYIDTDYKGWKLQSKHASRSHNINLYLYTCQTQTLADWQSGLQKIIDDAKRNEKSAWHKTREWWTQYWNRSFVFINNSSSHKAQMAPTTHDTTTKDLLPYQVGRNYQLFRYMLGCNAFGSYPTKFNGGLFTYDPCFTDTNRRFTPDYRNWGGGLMTAQNQRLVYFPMLKNGDFEMMKPQFDFYLRSLRNAELRSETYWGHKGACFAEQLENFGLPNSSEYGWERPEWFDKGVEYNAWLEYEWDTVLEFCFMVLETERYNNNDISVYIPLIESSLTFFNEHYQYLAKRRGRKAFDANGDLILYPGSGGETYKMAYNSTSTILALQTVLTRLLELPPSYLSEQKRKEWKVMLDRIPPIAFSEFNGHKIISPARLWERVNNTETMQLYPVFPWGTYGIGKPGLDVAVNTWKYDTLAIKFRSHIGWKQDNIFAARLGLTDEASRLCILKLKDSGRRFPAFWGPGFDWTPDHNWGGSGMIGLQEMLLQTDGKRILLFPAWPKTWDVHFKLHAPYQTTVEAILKDGKIALLNVVPESREKDILNLLVKD
jgi:hypothetical protein